MINVVLSNGQQQGGGLFGGIGLLVFYALIFAAFYFFAIRPQKKRQKAQDALVASVEVGDYVLTTSGFYGEIIDIVDEHVVVEFGNNTNCRIPMKKEAIVEVEKAKK